VTWHSQETRLTIHYENGFTLTDARSGIDSSGKSQILWSFPFDRLKMSADDGQRLLWLDFGGDEGEQVSKHNRHLTACPDCVHSSLESNWNIGKLCAVIPASI
jgi:hypothetical protein